ncbi:MAG: transglycosylase domain-containing protein, partial [Chthoniobacterales bacterium]
MKKILAALAVLLVIASAAIYIAAALQEFPVHLAGPGAASTEFVDRNGEPLRTMLVEEKAYRRRVALEDISPHVVAATLAAEDRNFYAHPGFDPLAIMRATYNAVRQAKPLSGASTITQQLVKANG